MYFSVAIRIFKKFVGYQMTAIYNSYRNWITNIYFYIYSIVLNTNEKLHYEENIKLKEKSKNSS